MSAPLDLDAIRQWYESTRLSAGPWHPIAQQVPALLAEVERLRAESVPRSSLVQVGWQVKRGVRVTLELGRPFSLEGCQPVYVIREDTDA